MAALTYAAAPLSTDDPGVLSPGQCEYEVYLSSSRQAGSVERAVSPQVGCGMRGQTQLSFSGTSIRGPDGRSGFIGLRGKTMLRESSGESAGDVGLAVGYGWTGRRHDDRWRHSAAGITLLAVSTLRPGTALMVNLGHAHQVEVHRHATNWGVAIEQDATAALTAVAEVFGDDLASPCWAAGLRWKPAGSDLSFGLTWGYTRGSERTRHLNAGATWTH